MTAPSPAAAGLPAEDVERVARAIRSEWLRILDGWDDWDQAEEHVRSQYRRLAAAALAEMQPAAAVPDPREGIDWSKHRGSCRVFYAERRCTCGAVPDSRFRDQLAEEMWAKHDRPGAGIPWEDVSAGTKRMWLRWASIVAAEVEARVQAAANNEVAVEDIRAIAVALGLGDHARPYSPHELVQREILPALANSLDGTP